MADGRYQVISILVAIILIIINVFSIFVFGFNIIESLIVIGVSVVLYVGLVFFLAVQPRSERVRIVNRPVVREVVRTVEKPVEVVRTVVRPVVKYVEKKKKKLDIEKFEYIGSSVNKVYHTRNCRLGKMIKKKYKELSHQKSFFVKRKYKPCHVCILKDKKV